MLSIQYTPPSPFALHPYLLASPSTLSSAALLPDEPAALFDALGAPVFVGRAWPSRRVPAGTVHAPVAPAVLARVRDGASLRRAPSSLSAAAAVSVARAAGASSDTRGGPTLAALRALCQGVVLPPDGLVLALTEGGGGLRLRAVGSAPAFVDGSTEFFESRVARAVPAAKGDATGARIAEHARGPMIGGLDRELAELAELCAGALEKAQSFSSRGLRPPRGALVSGPPGTGKTLLAAALADRVGVQLTVVNGAELLGAHVGETEVRLRAAWAHARGGVLFLDEVDALAPARDPTSDADGAGEEETRIVAALLSLMDGIESDGDVTSRVFVLGATNRAGAIDAALRRPGRFDIEVVVPVPSAAARGDILRACLSRHPHVVDDGALDGLARDRMHGFVGADIAAACREGALVALRRLSASSATGGPSLEPPSDSVAAIERGLRNVALADCDTTLVMTLEDLKAGLARVQPSALRSIAVEVAATPWSAIAGQEEAKARLREAIEWPTQHAAYFAALGIRAPRGILLYGPPGCSKTMMARAMATSSKSNFIAVKVRQTPCLAHCSPANRGALCSHTHTPRPPPRPAFVAQGPELFSKFVGDSEKAVAEVFSRARAAAPCVIFFDEFDALAAVRDDSSGTSAGIRVVAQLLQELDGVVSSTRNDVGVVVVAATNRPDLIDPALLRPGRMDSLLYIGLPDATARSAIIASALTNIPCAGDVDVASIADATDGYSGAEVVGVMRDACLRAVHASTSTGAEGALLERRNVDAAIAAAPKQVTSTMLDFYKCWNENARE